MGFRARLERKTSQKIVDAMRTLDATLPAEVFPAPCHIVDETHQGILFPGRDAYALVYRCQLKWWGRTLTAEDVADIRGPAGELHLARVGVDRRAQLILSTLGGIHDNAAAFVTVGNR